MSQTHGSHHLQLYFGITLCFRYKVIKLITIMHNLVCINSDFFWLCFARHDVKVLEGYEVLRHLN